MFRLSSHVSWLRFTCRWKVKKRRKEKKQICTGRIHVRPPRHVRVHSEYAVQEDDDAEHRRRDEELSVDTQPGKIQPNLLPKVLPVDREELDVHRKSDLSPQSSSVMSGNTWSSWLKIRLSSEVRTLDLTGSLKGQMTQDLLLTLDQPSNIGKNRLIWSIWLFDWNLWLLVSQRSICTELSYLIRSTGWYLCMTP